MFGDMYFGSLKGLIFMLKTVIEAESKVGNEEAIPADRKYWKYQRRGNWGLGNKYTDLFPLARTQL